LVLCGVAAAQQFTFGAAGDFETGDDYIAVVDRVGVANVNFMLALGDLAYEQDTEAWWCQQWIDRTNVSDLFITAGTHDIGEECCGTLQAYLDACPSTTDVQGTPGIQYYLDYPTNNPIARFLMITPGINGTIGSYNLYNRGQIGYVWMETAIDDARAKNITWIIVGMHKVFISVLERSAEVAADLMTLLFRKRVDLILQGHEHGYERSKQLTCATVNVYDESCVAEATPSWRGKGTTIVVLGTGGQTLRTMNVDDPEWNYFQVADVTTFGFGHFAVAPDRLVYNFRRSSGGTLSDTFTLKYAPIPAPTPSSNGTDSNPPTPASLVTRFEGNAAAIIAVISLFLVCVFLLAIGVVFWLVCKRKHHATTQVGVEVEAVEPPKKSAKKASKAKDQTDGSVDYL